MEDTTSREQPLYQHDCERCTYLGRHEYDGYPVDLYHCEQDGTHVTVIARFSGDGGDYSSGLFFADTVPALGEAVRRARALGLPTE